MSELRLHRVGLAEPRRRYRELFGEPYVAARLHAEAAGEKARSDFERRYSAMLSLTPRLGLADAINACLSRALRMRLTRGELVTVGEYNYFARQVIAKFSTASAWATERAVLFEGYDPSSSVPMTIGPYGQATPALPLSAADFARMIESARRVRRVGLCHVIREQREMNRKRAACGLESFDRDDESERTLRLRGQFYPAQRIRDLMERVERRLARAGRALSVDQWNKVTGILADRFSQSPAVRRALFRWR